MHELTSESDLRSDCGSCFGLCCVALTLTRSSDFAIDKPAGKPCPNLGEDFGCGIHARLRGEGFSGCTVYDCFGAGQKVSQVTFAGVDWRADPGGSQRMFALLPVMKQLHELLWYVADALAREVARPVHAELRRVRGEIEALTRGSADGLLALDVDGQRQRVNALLVRVSELVRGEWAAAVPRKKNGKKRKLDLRGADLMGARRAGADLRGVNLRGAYVIAADLSGADLRGADVIGADFRDADVRGADLSAALFLTRTQVNAATGDAATRIPDTLERPAHWTA
ncbi:pentapeptide repeat-containing protein [Streptomyces sp. NPDC004111]|uniref:pentapeptide repeat-containing protein n=1 Tax=Streptomyces sp. NPDC004111 TaxID=3364690 RepID=UPI0036BCC68A